MVAVPHCAFHVLTGLDVGHNRRSAGECVFNFLITITYFLIPRLIRVVLDGQSDHVLARVHLSRGP